MPAAFRPPRFNRRRSLAANLGAELISASVLTGDGSAPNRWARFISWSRRHPEAVAIGLIVLTVLAANAPYLLGFFDPNPLGPRSGIIASAAPGRIVGLNTIDPNNGDISQALSHRAMLDLVHGHLPWWDPYEGLGSPLAGEMQAATFFPFTLLTLISNGQIWEHVLLEIIAGVATYLLLRQIGLRRIAATVAGAAFAVNGTFAWLSHATVNPVAFLPLLLLGIEQARAAAVKGCRGGIWLIPVAGALSFYAGFPEVAALDTLLAVFWFAGRLGGLDSAARAAYLRKLLAGIVTGVLVCAPLLVAFVDYLPHADLGGHDGNAYGSAHLDSRGLAALVIPYVYGPIFAFNDARSVVAGWWGSVGGYLTSTLILLGLSGLATRARRGLRAVLAVWIVLTIARVYEIPGFLGGVLGVIPGMGRIAFFRYSWSTLEFAAVVLAALAIDGLLTAPAHVRRVAIPIALTAAAVAAAALASRPLVGALGVAFAEHHFYRYAVAWAIAVAAIVAAAMFVRVPWLRVGVIAAALVADVGIQFAVPELSANRSITLDLAPVNYLKAHLGNGRYYSLSPLSPNYGSYFGLSELNVNDLPVPKPFQRYVTRHLAPDANALTFVGYTNGPGEPPSPTPTQELLQNLAGYRASAVKYVLTPPGQVLPQSGSTLQLVQKSPSAWIYHLSGAQPYFAAGDPGCRISDQTHEALTIDCPHPTRLLKRELDMAGWSASVDGHVTTVRRTPLGFQAITVPAGHHRVSFTFDPPHETLGWIAWALGLLGLAGTVGGAGLIRRLPGRSSRSGMAARPADRVH